MKRGKNRRKQAACCNSGMQTIVIVTMGKPPIRTHASGWERSMANEALPRKGKF